MNDFYQGLWNNIRNTLKNSLDETTFDDLLGDVTRVEKEQNGVIYVLVPDVYKKKRINDLLIERINSLISKYTTENLKFKFVLKEELVKDIPVFSNGNRLYVNHLNENYNFESYVVGESNMFAYRMSFSVADQPGLIANPLYIFGGVGLGKTHLMQAIGNYILDKDINNKILYVQATDFIKDYSKAVQTNSMNEFDEKYNDLDCLLVDDIQMLDVGKKSQQEFFKLFNDLYNRKKQIVITSDCPANQLKGIMDRLTSRFSSGMTVDIKRPGLEQRMSILRRKAEETSTKEVPDEVLQFIAEHFTDNIRELEGALTRVLGYCEFSNCDKVTVETTIDALDSLLKHQKNTVKNEQNFDNLLSIIANFYNITVHDILSNQRKQTYVLPRQIAMYILKSHYNLPYKKIGVILGNRDHTTVMSGYQKIFDEVNKDQDLKLAIDTILKKVD